MSPEIPNQNYEQEQPKVEQKNQPTLEQAIQKHQAQQEQSAQRNQQESIAHAQDEQLAEQILQDINEESEPNPENANKGMSLNEYRQKIKEQKDWVKNDRVVEEVDIQNNLNRLATVLEKVQQADSFDQGLQQNLEELFVATKTFQLDVAAFKLQQGQRLYDGMKQVAKYNKDDPNRSALDQQREKLYKTSLVPLENTCDKIINRLGELDYKKINGQELSNSDKASMLKELQSDLSKFAPSSENPDWKAAIRRFAENTRNAPNANPDSLGV